jgi:ubiquinone/menaquinone biosynthesis C-methylase UbiE
MLKKAEGYARRSGVNVQLVESDGTRIPLPNDSFDMVFLHLVYHEIADKKTVLEEFRRLLKPGGRVAIREKTENTLLPIGPPIVPVELIQTGLHEAGFGELHSVGKRRERIVIGVKPSKLP